MTDVRPFSPIPADLALVRRLSANQFLMDTTTALTRGINPLESALLAVLPLADLGFPTLVLRTDDIGYIGQIRHRAGDVHASLACLAPAPPQHENGISHLPWLQLIDGLVHIAGRRGALRVAAEINETAYSAFEILRKAGFVVYAHQTIFQRLPAKSPSLAAPKRVRLRTVTDADLPKLLTLHKHLISSLLQQADPTLKEDALRCNSTSLVVETIQDRRLLGHFAMIEGKSGLMVKPLLHPDIIDEAQLIIAAALKIWQKAERLPLYFCVRSYQEWLGTPLRSLDMLESERQVLLVKHTTVRLETEFEALRIEAEPSLGSLITGIEIKLHEKITGNNEL